MSDQHIPFEEFVAQIDNELTLHIDKAMSHETNLITRATTAIAIIGGIYGATDCPNCRMCIRLHTVRMLTDIFAAFDAGVVETVPVEGTTH